jgi:perosamine synthetase
MIEISAPQIGELEERLVGEVLRSGRLVKGPMGARFEEAVRATVDTRHAVALNSGTSALIAALLAHGIRAGDEVITSPFTFVATLNAILHVGAHPRFVDIGEDFNIDAALVPDACGPKTRAVLPVHLYGLPADLRAIVRACSGRDIVVIEDAAQALGATLHERPVGSFGTGCFSFYATKNVTTGEGGVVTTDDDDVATAVRVLRDQGQRGCYEYVRPGFNFRMSELQAALGVAQMTRLEAANDARRANAALLKSGLEGLEGLVLPAEPQGRTHVFHQFTVRVTGDAAATRDEVLRSLAARGINCGVYYPRPVFDYECFRSDTRIGNPSVLRAFEYSREVLSLPVHPLLARRDLDRVIEAMRLVLA